MRLLLLFHEREGASTGLVLRTSERTSERGFEQLEKEEEEEADIFIGKEIPLFARSLSLLTYRLRTVRGEKKGMC